MYSALDLPLTYMYMYMYTVISTVCVIKTLASFAIFDFYVGLVTIYLILIVNFWKINDYLIVNFD